MGGLSWVHWLILAAVLLLLFGGRHKISDLMGDFARGIRSFKEGLKEPPDAQKPEISTQKPEGQKPEGHS